MTEKLSDDDRRALIALHAQRPGLTLAHAEILNAEIDHAGDYAKIATALNLALGTVKSRLHRARKAFAILESERQKGEAA